MKLLNDTLPGIYRYPTTFWASATLSVFEQMLQTLTGMSAFSEPGLHEYNESGLIPCQEAYH